MASLAQLLATHGSVLVLDAVSLQVQIGLFRTGHAPCGEQSGDEAGRGLFRATEAILEKTGLQLGDIGAMAYCEGPGSMLGTRTVAMALRTWRTLSPKPVFRYQSLALAGLAEWQRSSRAFHVIADARRDSWHVQPVAADGSLGKLRRQPTAELPSGELLTPTGFRAWSQAPDRVATCPYDLVAMLTTTAEAEIMSPVVSPDVLQHDAPDYKKWSAQPHSAESVARS
jgi:tRNA threonylcarbamoyladenosine biosynthesis protein TsaB